MYQKEKTWQLQKSDLIRERSEIGKELFKLQENFQTMKNKNKRLLDEVDKTKRDLEMAKFAHHEENRKNSKIIEDLQSNIKVSFFTP